MGQEPITDRLVRVILIGLNPGGAKDSANFCVRIIQQKVTSHFMDKVPG